MFSKVEYEKSFITSGTDCADTPLSRESLMVFNMCSCHSVERQKVSIAYIKQPADYNRYFV